MDLGVGSDKLTLTDGANSATVSNVETLIGGTGADTITLGAAITHGSIDLGSGADTLTFGNFTDSVTLINVETIAGGSGSDTVTLDNALTTSMSVSLGSGASSLTLGNFTNNGTVSHVETLVGGTGTDTITLGSAITHGSIDLGGGADTLTFGAFTNSATVANVDTITGASGADSITLNTAIVGGTVDLGAGSDTLTLGGFTNHVSVSNVETVLGGSGNDTIVVSSGSAADIVGGGGVNQVYGHSVADVFVFNQDSNGNYTTVMNFDQAHGNKIGLDTTGAMSSGHAAYVLNGSLVNGSNITSVANFAALEATTLSTGGKGGFVYEQDTGQLFYSANGHFSTGGTLVGVITTDGSTPWTYNFGSFQTV